MARILVAEDETCIRLFVVETLENSGHTVLEAPDGQAALALIADDPDIDMVVSDIGLPKIDGISLALSARQLRPHMAVVFLTGYLRMELPRELSGATIIQKPFDADCLAGQIAAALDTRRPAPD